MNRLKEAFINTLIGKKEIALIIGLYLVLPFIFFGFQIDITKVALAPGDGAIQGVPFSIYSRQGNLWNPYVQSGTFPFKDTGTQAAYPLLLLVMNIFPNNFGYNVLLFLHYSMAGIFTFLFLKRLNIGQWSAFIAGLAFMFTGFLVAHKGHNTMVMAAIYLPMVLYFLESFFATTKTKYLALGAVSFGLSILADYIAMPVYIGMVGTGYVLFRVLDVVDITPIILFNRLMRFIVVIAVVFGGGLLIAAVQIFPVIESLKFVTRERITYDFFTSYSFPFKLMPILLIPYYYGTQAPNTLYPNFYFGPWNLTEMAGYMGYIPLISALLTMLLLRKKKPQVRFWTAVVIIGFVLVLGGSTPFYRIMFQVPVYNMFRASARNWLEVNFAFAVLSGFLLDAIHKKNLDLRSYRKNLLSISGFIFFIFFFLIYSLDYFSVSEQTDNLLHNNIQVSSFVVLIPLSLLIGSCVLLTLLPKLSSKKGFQIIFSIFLVADLFSFGHYHDFSSLNQLPQSRTLGSEISFFSSIDVYSDDYRIYFPDMNVGLYPNQNILYGFQAINGYGPIWLKNYYQFTKIEASGLSSFASNIINNNKVISSLSTRFIVASTEENRKALESVSFSTTPIINEPLSLLEDSVTLQSPQPGEVSIISIPIDHLEEGNLGINFDVRINPDQMPDDVLIVDLFGKDYDQVNREHQYKATEFSDGYKNIDLIIPLSDSDPLEFDLRFFTFSLNPYELSNIRVYKISNRVDRLTDASRGTTGQNVYVQRMKTPEGLAVYENLNVLPRLRFALQVIPVSGMEEVEDAFWNNPYFDPSTTALAEGIDQDEIYEPGNVLSEDYSSPTHLKFSLESGDKSFVVLADTFYPGWNAYVDGKKVEIYRTNGVMRGVEINGSGQHTLEYFFTPLSLYFGIGISTTAVTALLVLSYTLRNISWGKEKFM